MTARRHPLLVGGHTAAADAWMPVRSPGDGSLLGEVAAAGVDDVDRAVGAAVTAGVAWAAEPPLARADLLSSMGRLLATEAPSLAAMLHAEEGKPLAEAEAEIARAIDVVHHFAGEAARLSTEHLVGRSPGGGSRIRPAALGVVGAIIPWNFPVALLIWKLAPALAAGCSIVVKPAIEAPLTVWAVCDIARRAGIPEGVVSCITGDGPLIGEALATHPKVAKIAFTGSRAVGEKIAAWTSPRLKALTLELGGHGALLVLPDADLDIAAEVAAVQGYANSGQACYSVNRVLVPEARLGDLLERLRARIAGIRLGPMATTRGLERHAMLLADARAHGATVDGGEEVTPGTLSPALVTGAGPGVRLIDEEPFTPIVAVMGYREVGDAVAEVNRPDYGLVNYLCGRDLRACLEVAESLQSGTVVVNGWQVVVPYAPYSGWRGSGVGAELGRPGLEAFIRWQHVRVLR